MIEHLYGNDLFCPKYFFQNSCQPSLKAFFSKWPNLFQHPKRVGNYVRSPNGWGFDSENSKILWIYSLFNIKKFNTFLQLSATSYISCFLSEFLNKENNVFITAEKPYDGKKGRLIPKHYFKYFFLNRQMI